MRAISYGNPDIVTFIVFFGLGDRASFNKVKDKVQLRQLLLLDSWPLAY